MPVKNPTTKSWAKVMWPQKEAAGTDRSRSPRPTSPTISTARRGSRSTHTPAGKVKSRKGRNSTVPRAATAKAEACRCLIAMIGSASSEIDEPNWLIVWPVHIFMKSRCDHRAPDGLRIDGGGAGDGGQRVRLEHAALQFGLGRRGLLHGLGHLLHLQHGAEGDGEDRERVTDAADPERRPQAEPGRQTAAEQSAERDRSPHDPAHGRVHAALEPLGRDRLTEADLRDVVRHRAE